MSLSAPCPRLEKNMRYLVKLPRPRGEFAYGARAGGRAPHVAQSGAVVELTEEDRAAILTAHPGARITPADAPASAADRQAADAREPESTAARERNEAAARVAELEETLRLAARDIKAVEQQRDTAYRGIHALAERLEGQKPPTAAAAAAALRKLLPEA